MLTLEQVVRDVLLCLEGSTAITSFDLWQRMTTRYQQEFAAVWVHVALFHQISEGCVESSFRKGVIPKNADTSDGPFGDVTYHLTAKGESEKRRMQSEAIASQQTSCS